MAEHDKKMFLAVGFEHSFNTQELGYPTELEDVEIIHIPDADQLSLWIRKNQIRKEIEIGREIDRVVGILVNHHVDFLAQEVLPYLRCFRNIRGEMEQISPKRDLLESVATYIIKRLATLKEAAE